MRARLKLGGKLVEGSFKARLSRFSALVKISNKEIKCFLPNPGRLLDLLVPEAKVILREAKSIGRKTFYDLLAVGHDGEMVSIDSRLPNHLMLEVLRKGLIRGFSMYGHVKPEFTFGHSKFDFLLANDGKCLLEVKSCTLVKNRRALFPDAPTERGRRHVLELIKAKMKGYRACIVFLVQRPDAMIFSPNDDTDPAFGEALRLAAKKQVEIYAYLSRFDGRFVELLNRIRVDV